MQGSKEPNARSSSTTWAWKKVKISEGRMAIGNCPPKAARWHHLPWRNPRDWQTITIRYTGGESAWYEVKARGSAGKIEGFHCLHDVMCEINQWGRKPGNAR